jgi:uncharacterized iron-regulated membrane protein
MAVTGVLLTYERQMIAWADSGLRSAPATADARRLPVEALLARVRADRPDLAVTAVTVAAPADAPVTLSAGQQVLYADAYSGQVLGDASQGMRRFMSRTRAWHRWLAVEGEGRPLARAVTGWSNVLFLFTVVSGFYLWFPRTWSWRHLRPVVFFRRGLRGKARDFNWHNAIGVWSAIPLFIVVLSALPMSFPWANAMLYRAAGDVAPAPGGREGNAGSQGQARGGREGGQGERGRSLPSLDGLDARWDAARAQTHEWRTINMRIPASATAPVVFAIDRGDGGQPQLRSTLALDRQTGAVVSYETFTDQTPGRRLRSVMRFAHTGEVLGLPGQTIAGLATAGAVVLIWTGIGLALRRLRSWSARRRQPAAALAA